MTPLTRRAFVSSALLASAHCALGQRSSQHEPVPPLRFPTDPRQRIGVATYPFRASIIAPGNTDRNPALPGMDLAAFARFIRREFDVSGIEPLHSHFPSTAAAQIQQLRAAFDAAGVRTVNIPVDARADLGSTNAAVRERSIAIYHTWVDIAVALASPSIRIAVPHCAGPSDTAGPAHALQPVVDYASSRGIIVNLENDNPVYESAARIVAVLRAANTPWLRALPDFANSLMGGDAHFNAAAVRSMFAYAADIAHVKDAEMIQGTRRTVSLPELFAFARAAHYRGFFSMESDSDTDPVRDTHHLIERSIALM